MNHQSPGAQRPNLLYIHSDQHNPAVTGCYGDPLVQTPNLDRLAEQGIVFENVYCPSPICVPSRMSMLTGRHPYENEVWTNNHILDSGIPTFAHAMGAAGYRPVLIGRMHALGPDQLHGYAERLVGDHGPNHLGGPGVDHGMLSGTAGPARVSLEKSGPGQSAYQVHDEDVTAATVDYLNRLGVRKRAGVLDEPFSVSVGFMLPHQPFVARRADYDLYQGKMTMPKHPEPFSEDLHPYFRWWREQCGIVEVTEAEILRARTAYWALVTRMDAMIGEILEALRANDLAENTVILYSSDHGEQVGEHGLWWKQTFYEHSATVPAILSWPGVLPEGIRCDRVISALDLNATMLDALDALPLPSSHGRSVLPLVRDENPQWEDIAFSEYCTDEGCIHRMVRRGDWKLNYYHGQPPQLFNLKEDPDELHDRTQDPMCQEIQEILTQRVLEGWNPDLVAEKMAARRAERKILTDWARHTQPKDLYRRNLLPEMDYLD
ncbi:MAG: sulfatase-like hydrolase/transferase [Candidatus Poribacteria bacterium]|nr:sulfatase-like hydrolase/transferase [Candidatus Poribacteria bacterium]